LLRGVEIEVTLQSDRFAGDGDLELFGEMLNRFLALYATLNLFTKLVLIRHSVLPRVAQVPLPGWIQDGRHR
jgi:type VI protein secretion system component VasA